MNTIDSANPTVLLSGLPVDGQLADPEALAKLKSLVADLGTSTGSGEAETGPPNPLAALAQVLAHTVPCAPTGPTPQPTATMDSPRTLPTPPDAPRVDFEPMPATISAPVPVAAHAEAAVQSLKQAIHHAPVRVDEKPAPTAPTAVPVPASAETAVAPEVPKVPAAPVEQGEAKGILTSTQPESATPDVVVPLRRETAPESAVVLHEAPIRSEIVGAAPQVRAMPEATPLVAPLPVAGEASVQTGPTLLPSEPKGIRQTDAPAAPLQQTPVPQGEAPRVIAPHHEKPAPPSLGAEILQSLGLTPQPTPVGAPTATPEVTAATPAAAIERVTRVEDLMNAVVDRVLVSDPLHSATREVRLKFQDSVLPATEARVWREDGRVRVEFVSHSAESVEWLQQTVSHLAQRLDERLTTAAPSLVTIDAGNGAPDDGRSRNRQNPWDLLRDDESAA